MTEFLFCFSCCIGEQPQPQRRRRIDRSMIGEPMNFVHTAHVGSGDANAGFAMLYAKKEMRLPVRISHVGRYVQPVSSRAGFRQAIEGGSFQDQMKSKGGYTPGISEVAL